MQFYLTLGVFGLAIQVSDLHSDDRSTIEMITTTLIPTIPIAQQSVDDGRRQSRPSIFSTSTTTLPPETLTLLPTTTAVPVETESTILIPTDSVLLPTLTRDVGIMSVTMEPQVDSQAGDEISTFSMTIQSNSGNNDSSVEIVEAEQEVGKTTVTTLSIESDEVDPSVTLENKQNDIKTPGALAIEPDSSVNIEPSETKENDDKTLGILVNQGDEGSPQQSRFQTFTTPIGNEGAVPNSNIPSMVLQSANPRSTNVIRDNTNVPPMVNTADTVEETSDGSPLGIGSNALPSPIPGTITGLSLGEPLVATQPEEQTDGNNLPGNQAVGMNPAAVQEETVDSRDGLSNENTVDLPALPNAFPPPRRGGTPGTRVTTSEDGVNANEQPLPPVSRTPVGNVSILSSNNVAQNVLIFGLIGVLAIGIFVFNYDRLRSTPELAKPKLEINTNVGSTWSDVESPVFSTPSLLIPRVHRTIYDDDSIYSSMDLDSISMDLDSVLLSAQILMTTGRSDTDDNADPFRPSLDEFDYQLTDESVSDYVHL
jgi:hypothetical protein